MLVKFIAVQPISEREYTDRLGNKQVFKSKGFTMQTSDGTLYAEAVQELAESLNKMEIKSGDCALVQLSSVAREYTTQSGEKRVSNEFTLRQVAML